ncbi:hypothetical protein evm_009482 [Chilo suppressalis]|nr:hypothetical protein evm_009482 [Chilo suppressalis]
MESLQNEAVYLLDDSGYALREHMMTPIDNAVKTSPEGAFIDVPELTEDEFQSERSRQVPTESATSSARALEAGRRVRATLMQILERNRR